MKEERKVIAVDFRVLPGEDIHYAVECMKQYQALGLAGKDSHIIYHGASIPAGYFDSTEEVLSFYDIMNQKDVDVKELIHLLPEDIPLLGLFDIIIGLNGYRLDHELSLCSGSKIRTAFMERQSKKLRLSK